MRKLRKLNLNETSTMSNLEMKNIVGGYGYSGGYSGESASCTTTCTDRRQVTTSNCSKSTADSACGGTGKASQCAGKASTCG